GGVGWPTVGVFFPGLWGRAAGAAHVAELRVGSLTHPAFQLQDIRLHLTQARGLVPESGWLSVARARWNGQEAGPFRVDCGRINLSRQAMSCEQASLQLRHADWGTLELRGELHYQPAGERLRVDLEGTLDGTPLRVRGEWTAGTGSLQLRLSALPLNRLEPLSGDPGWYLDGTADISVSAQLEPGGALSGTVVTQLNGATISNPEGTIATDGLSATLVTGLRQQGAEQRGTVRLIARGGQAYVDPVFLDLDETPADAVAHVLRRGDDLWLERLRLRQPEVLSAHGEAHLRMPPALSLERLTLTVEQAVFPQAYLSYLQPFLIGTTLDRLETSGRISGDLRVRNGRPESARMLLQDVGIDDQLERFSFQGLQGPLHWTQDASVPPTDIRWDGGQLYRINIGAGRLDARLFDTNFHLRRPLRLPLEDGALHLDVLSARDLGRPQFSAELEGRLEPISLQALSRALDWPVMRGTVSGTIPRVQYRNRMLQLDGALRAEAFDGTLVLDRFRLSDPLGRMPLLEADIRMRNLDLRLLTGTFEFGRITGRLHGDVRRLELLDWEPVAFDAHFYTPPGDRSTRRISQRAIENISDIGGGGGALLSRTALRFFEDFRYQQLAIRCVLRDEVCRMSGLEREGEGYLLVQGSGLPRVDVIGFNRDVSWPTLLEQLQAVTQ
ncbi:MAG: hypothetical protein JJU06_01040, partial [Ectothiorhodospiraceae bacterium]|nr:hypothetical protein [Ectothiorhodospiraceae bacterium]